MSETGIEWVKNADGSQGQTWNPVVGCKIVSPGCTNCYAMRMAARLEAMRLPRYVGLTAPSKAGPVWTGEMRFVEEVLTLPLRTRKPTTWFVNSMSDLFAEGVPDAWIDQIFAVMALAPQHTFQVLTKRAGRMREYLSRTRVLGYINGVPSRDSHARSSAHGTIAGWIGSGAFPARVYDRAADHLARLHGIEGRGLIPIWPLPNVWLGVSAEDQRRADERVPDLLATPAAVRFVSAEPLLGGIDFRALGHDPLSGEAWDALSGSRMVEDPGDSTYQGGVSSRTTARLDWIIVGGESGPGARPMHPAWVRQIRDACAATGVAFLFKQWGAYRPHPLGGGIPLQLNGRAAGSERSFSEVCDDPSIAWMQCVGKKAAGRLLDGVVHDALPVRSLAS